MIHLISVEPIGEGWAVRTDDLANDMIFHSGGAAEASEVQIRLRGGALAARFASPARLGR